MTEQEEFVNVDLAPFLAAVVAEAGGEVIIKYDTLAALDANQVALALDATEDQKGISIRLVEPPENYNE